jgi:hypothetical protein
MSERLTLVIFKDHLSSRTLTVRLAWLRAFGLALLSVIGLAVISAALFLNAYRKTLVSGSVANAMRVEELEKETAEAKASYEAIKNHALNNVAGEASLPGAENSFSLLPPEALLEKLPAVESLPFRLETIKAQWKGSTLQIRSAIEYSREDGGNQQGHFLILVRGPNTLSIYPDDAFNDAGSTSLVKPSSGEFFSVSRYREIKADFGGYSKHDDVHSIELFIFDLNKRLIFVHRTGLEKTTKSEPAAEKAPPKAKPAPKAKEPVAPAAAPAPAGTPTVTPEAEPTLPITEPGV